MSLASRNLVHEKMDDPHLDPVLHRQALAGLRRIHWWSGTASAIAGTILELADRRDPQAVRILDVGCGGGDVTAQVAHQVSKAIPCCVTGWDISPTAIETATRHCESIEARSQGRCRLHFGVRDIFSVFGDCDDREPAFDFAYCSLFLHHFEHEQAVALLNRMMQWTRRGIIIDDLMRSRFGLFLAFAGCRLLSRSKVVHFDGPQSVRAAFTVSEMKRMASLAGVETYKIRRHWPARFQWIGLHQAATDTNGIRVIDS